MKETARRFDRARVVRWRRDVLRIFAGHGFPPLELSAALVLAAVASFGTDLGVLGEITGLSSGYCRQVLRRLRKSRVLTGTTLRAAWDDDHGSLAVVLDAGVAAGLFVRAPDPARSAAQKARLPSTRARGPRARRAAIPDGAVFTPGRSRVKPLYGLPDDQKGTKR